MRRCREEVPACAGRACDPAASARRCSSPNTDVRLRGDSREGASSVSRLTEDEVAEPRRIGSSGAPAASTAARAVPRPETRRRTVPCAAERQPQSGRLGRRPSDRPTSRAFGRPLALARGRMCGETASPLAREASRGKDQFRRAPSRRHAGRHDSGAFPSVPHSRAPWAEGLVETSNHSARRGPVLSGTDARAIRNLARTPRHPGRAERRTKWAARPPPPSSCVGPRPR